MAAQRTTSNPKAKSDGISSNTLEKAQTAKDYIERKYKKLKKVEQTSKIE